MHLTSRERNAALALLAAKVVENQYNEITLALSIDKSGFDASSWGEGETWTGMDELERLDIQATFKENRGRFLSEALREVKMASYAHATRWFSLGPRALEGAKTYLRRRCEAAAVTPVGAADGLSLVPLTSLAEP